MNDNEFYGNLRGTNGDVYVKASGFASGIPVTNNVYNSYNAQKSASAPARRSGPIQTYGPGATIFGDAPWNNPYTYERRAKRAQMDRMVEAYGKNGKYSISEASAAVGDDGVFNDIIKKVGTVGYYDREKKIIADTINSYLDKRAKEFEKENSTEVEGSTNRVTKEGAGSTTERPGQQKVEAAEDIVEFTLPSANDPSYRGFGQKIVDLGLATDHGLWGTDGDIEFYTKQLYDQGALDERGNLRIGVPIRLKRRKNRNQ